MQRMNLTAVKDADKIMERNVEDSLAILPPLRDCYRMRCGGAPSHEKLSLVDVRTGAGLPGVVLSIACPGEFFAAFFPCVIRFSSFFLRVVIFSLFLQLKWSRMGSYTNGVHEQEMSILGTCCWNYRFSNIQIVRGRTEAKGSDSTATIGTKAKVYAAEASDKNDLQEKILLATVDDYIELVRAHINAGSMHHFTCRQLLLLGAMFNYSDATNRKSASAFLQELVHKPPENEIDNEGNVFVIGDGLSFGRDNDWAQAVARLARKVYAALGEFDEVVLAIIEELAQPCRERIADYVQWMHCLSLIGLLLRNVKSMRLLQGKAIEIDELLQSLLLAR
ncbi:hypothetical protein S83_028571, partial [Arachis hypogaea]